MTKKIAVASGKGGTGKTTISVNLSHFFNLRFPQKTILVDCDVEEPNDHLFFPKALEESSEEIFQQVASINTDACVYCRDCVEYCEYHAITVIPPVKYAKIDPELCHSCGACFVACQHQAIDEIPNSLGHYKQQITKEGIRLAQGQLRIGSPMQTTLIKEIKKRIDSKAEIIVYDAPPGTSCPVVETIADAHFIVLVTEPTPFGLHDLKLTIELVRELKIPFSVIINKAGLGFEKMHDYLQQENIDILGEIPFSKEYASHYSQGEILSHISEDISKTYQEIIDQILIKLAI